jgi:hypothetical protein
MNDIGHATSFIGKRVKEMNLQELINYFHEQAEVAKESWKMADDPADYAKYWAYHLAYMDAEFKASNIQEGK